MHNDEIIAVVGMASGGTSVAAGLLFHLGVNMGTMHSVEEIRENVGTGADIIRDYNAFECQSLMNEIRALNVQAHDPTWGNLDQVIRHYIERRMREAINSPVGFKNNDFPVLGLRQDAGTLPVRIVQMKRNLDDTFESHIAKAGPNVNNAISRGIRHLGIHCLLEKIPPVVSLQFEEVLGNPSAAINNLVDRLQLNPEPGQVDAAKEFISRDDKGIVT